MMSQFVVRFHPQTTTAAAIANSIRLKISPLLPYNVIESRASSGLNRAIPTRFSPTMRRIFDKFPVLKCSPSSNFIRILNII